MPPYVQSPSCDSLTRSPSHHVDENQINTNDWRIGTDIFLCLSLTEGIISGLKRRLEACEHVLDRIEKHEAGLISLEEYDPSQKAYLTRVITILHCTSRIFHNVIFKLRATFILRPIPIIARPVIRSDNGENIVFTSEVPTLYIRIHPFEISERDVFVRFIRALTVNTVEAFIQQMLGIDNFHMATAMNSPNVTATIRAYQALRRLATQMEATQ